MPIKTFFLAETNQVRRYLRRYRPGAEHRCAARGGKSYCDALTPLDTVQRTPNRPVTCGGDWPADDPRLPTRCEACGEAFTDQDERQLFARRVYRRADTGELLDSAKPVGAVWDAWWYPRKGPDGRSLFCMTPGGEWHIDNRASNCTLPGDKEHRCWVRHGRPEDGTLHVDKAGHTCAAGAGSIVVGAYHGFLHHGFLTAC